MSASRAAAAAPAALAALAALAAAGCGSGAPERETPPAVLLIVGDTVRADHVGCYGYERETTPALDALAGEGERFDRAFAQSSWTLPSIASILTGQPPHVHGAGRAEGGVLPLRTEVATLAERLQAAGFATAAWINVLWLAPQSGAQRGFDVYDYRKTDATNRTMRDAKATTDAALAWMRRQRDAPFFMTVHYFDPHLTYDPPAPYDEMFRPQEAPRLPRGFGSADQVFEIRSGSRQLDTAEKEALVARYDGELRYMDDQIGRLLDGLRDLGRWDDALVIFVSDHGEEFWDHGGFEHGHTHYREMIRVPLIVKRPGGAGRADRPGAPRRPGADRAGVRRPAGGSRAARPLVDRRRAGGRLGRRRLALVGRPRLGPRRRGHADPLPRHRAGRLVPAGGPGRAPAARGRAGHSRRATARPAPRAAAAARRAPRHVGADGGAARAAALPRLRPVAVRRGATGRFRSEFG